MILTFNSCKVFTCTDQTEKSLIQTDCISPEGESLILTDCISPVGESLIQKWCDKSWLYKKCKKKMDES